MLGQNFLVDRNVVRRIVDTVDPSAGDCILEIGPGQGAITRELVESGATVLAIELDRRLAPALAAEFAGNDRFEIIEADILSVDLRELLCSRMEGRWKVAANLPYNISSQVLIKFLETPDIFSGLVLMLQKEVGERLVAPPSCKEYGILTLFCRLHFDITRELIVRPGSFTPAPKVDSVVLSFKPLLSPRVNVGNELLFRRIVKAAFGQRRKTLWNCLRSARFLPEDTRLSAVLSECGIDPGRRGETLSLEEYALLTRTIMTEMG